jgi:hypothetical protein
MFSFMRRSAARRPSKAIRRALERDGLPPGIGSASTLRVVEFRGRFSDREVTHIRIFDPVRVAEHALNVRSFRDLDTCPDMVIRAGHIETNGSVFITRKEVGRDAEPRLRTAADRATRSDDAHLVKSDEGPTSGVAL